MSRFYDALTKAQWKQSAHKKRIIPFEPGPDPKAAGPEKEVDRETTFLDDTSEITSEKAAERARVAYERIARVTVKELVAKPDTLMAEQFRKLRSIVNTHNMANSLRSVLVTSCMPGEGKTKVAINLSAIIARGLDDSVILVDADLRKKSLSFLLGLQNTLGLSDVLAERAGIQEAIINTEINGLTVLPAGFNPPNPAELIASIRMKSLVERLKEGHNGSYILIDSTPIVSTSEANVLSQMVDGVIVVIMADKTRRDAVKRELHTINSEKILGVVLNCAEFETSDYYNKYQIHYYHKERN